MSRVANLIGVSTINSSDAAGGGLVGTPVGAGNVMLSIQTPVTLPEVVYLEASVEDGVWARVQVNGVDVVLPENRIVTVLGFPAKQLRAASTTPVSGDRRFVFWNILDI